MTLLHSRCSLAFLVVSRSKHFSSTSMVLSRTFLVRSLANPAEPISRHYLITLNPRFSHADTRTTSILNASIPVKLDLHKPSPPGVQGVSWQPFSALGIHLRRQGRSSRQRTCSLVASRVCKPIIASSQEHVLFCMHIPLYLHSSTGDAPMRIRTSNALQRETHVPTSPRVEPPSIKYI